MRVGVEVGVCCSLRRPKEQPISTCMNAIHAHARSSSSEWHIREGAGRLTVPINETRLIPDIDSGTSENRRPLTTTP